MKTRQELEAIKNLVDSTYSKFGNRLKVDTSKPLNLENPEFGYCYKDTIPDKDRELYIYNIVCSKTGKPNCDMRIMMHEYGHIYLGHLDGIHEQYDILICNLFRDHRGELIDRINKNCGINFAEKLIERVIDDPVLNHSLHNIAMDMEVNSKVIDLDDVVEMEKDASEILGKYEVSLLKKYSNNTQDEKIKKQIEDQIKKMKKEQLVKFIHPSRYHLPNGNPFESELSYPEYLMFIVENLDQFVKMLVSIQNGGNGDTKDITSEQVRKTLNDMQGQSQGGEPSMQSLDDLMQSVGMSDSSCQQGGSQDGNSSAGGQGNESGQGNGNPSNGTNTGSKGDAGNQNSPYSGKRDDGNGGKDGNSNGSELNGDSKQPGGTHKDHMSDSRKDADKKRETGEIHSAGGFGCGSGHGDGERSVVKRQDTVDMAIDEVIKNFKHKVIKHEMRKDMMWNWNRGINRSVIAPSIKSKVTVSEEPKIVFLIDVSGSMDTDLIDRVLGTIAKKMKKIGRGLHYDIIAWDTKLCKLYKDVDPKKSVPSLPWGGGTRMAKGIEYFKEHYDPSAILILISDFEDYLGEWNQVEMTMPQYTMYGFNYGYNSYRNQTQKFKYFKVKNFNKSSR